MMAQGLYQSTSLKNARVVFDAPHVKSAETRKLFNAGVSGKLETGKSAYPSCYNAVTVKERTGLFDIVEMKMEYAFKRGDRVAIFNSTLGGKPIFEGYATVLKRLDTDHYYRVKFKKARSGSGENGEYDRFAFPGDQQSDPDGYLDRQQAEYQRRQQPQYAATGAA